MMMMVRVIMRMMVRVRKVATVRNRCRGEGI